ncbi:MAG: class I SAM-dependent methyltransferase [Pelagibacterales bacterium]|nr:class I SAM-dependent methyltransferase [Pelagibacterales bacterium]
MIFSKEQLAQENLYKFPYHYCVNFKKYFSMIYLFDWGINYASTVEFILKKIENQANIKSIIDIGCGEGRLTRELSLNFPDIKVDGVDYSKRAIQLATALNSNTNIHFMQEDIIQNSLVNKYDVATLMEVYEHIDPSDATAFLKGIHNSLNEDGVLYLTVPHKNIPQTPHHYRHFSIKSLTHEVEEYFDIEEVIPFEKISKKRKWIMRIMANRLFILNSKRLNTLIYNYYKKNLFFVNDETECQRIYLKCSKKKISQC